MEQIPNSEKINPNELMKRLDRAVQYGSREDLLALFDGGMDINQVDFSGRTALQLLSFSGDEEGVRILIERNADVNHVYMHHDRIPLTALDAARERGHKKVVDLLLEHGAKTGRELQPKA
ncbi:MAG: potassium channel [Patescibacteria group bacterium]|nr:potassium channel [Patescibacteria group bacterium]